MTGADPLAQLRDIHLPEAVGWWPPAPGWWLLALLAVAVLAVGAWACYRHYRAGAYRRAARAELNNAYSSWRETADSRAYIQTANAILKRVALYRFPDRTVAGLSGAGWCGFLDRHWRKPGERSFADSGLADAVYRPSGSGCDIEGLHDLSLTWLRQQGNG